MQGLIEARSKQLDETIRGLSEWLEVSKNVQDPEKRFNILRRFLEISREVQENIVPSDEKFEMLQKILEISQAIQQILAPSQK